LNGKPYYVGHGYYVVVTLANDKKIYWGGEHNYAYSFFFDHYREDAQRIIQEGGLPWYSVDAHYDYAHYLHLPLRRKEQVNWQQEMSFGEQKLNANDYLGYSATTGIASHIEKVQKYGNEERLRDGRITAIPAYHYQGILTLLKEDIIGGVFDLDIDYFVGTRSETNETVALEKFEEVRPHLITLAERTDVSIFINSSELDVNFQGVPMYIHPHVAVHANATLISDIAQRASPVTDHELRAKFLTGDISVEEFIETIMEKLDRFHLSVPREIARPDIRYSFDGVIIGDDEGIRQHRQKIDLKALMRAVKDPVVRKRCSVAIKKFLNRVELATWSNLEASEIILEMIRTVADEEDFDRELKEKAYNVAFKLLNTAEDMVNSADDTLARAIRISAFGNAFDFLDQGMREKLNDSTYDFAALLEEEFTWKHDDRDDYLARFDAVKGAETPKAIVVDDTKTKQQVAGTLIPGEGKDPQAKHYISPKQQEVWQANVIGELKEPKYETVLKLAEDLGISVFHKDNADYSEFLRNAVCWFLDEYFRGTHAYLSPHVLPPVIHSGSDLYTVYVDGIEGIPDYMGLDENYNTVPVAIDEYIDVNGLFAKVGIYFGIDALHYKNVIYDRADLDEVIQNNRVRNWKIIDYETSNVLIKDGTQLQQFVNDQKKSICATIGLEAFDLLQTACALLENGITDKQLREEYSHNYVQYIQEWFKNQVPVIQSDSMWQLKVDRSKLDLNTSSLFKKRFAPEEAGTPAIERVKEYLREEIMELSRDDLPKETASHDGMAQILINENVPFRNEHPEMFDLFTNVTKAAKLLKIASTLRDRFPYDEKKYHPLDIEGPLAFALRKGYYLHLYGNVYITPITESFRRHIVFEMDADGIPGYAVEIKIPGRQATKRIIDKKNFDVVLVIHKKYPDSIVAPLLFCEFPTGTYTLFEDEEPWQCDDKNPLRFVTYEYKEDGRRLLRVGKEGLDTIIEKNPQLYDGDIQALKFDIVNQSALLLAKLHHAGYKGFHIEIGEKHPILNSDMHTENVRMIVNDKKIKLILCGDVAAFSELGDFGYTIREEKERERVKRGYRKKDIYFLYSHKGGIQEFIAATMYSEFMKCYTDSYALLTDAVGTMSKKDIDSIIPGEGTDPQAKHYIHPKQQDIWRANVIGDTIPLAAFRSRMSGVSGIPGGGGITTGLDKKLLGASLGQILKTQNMHAMGNLLATHHKNVAPVWQNTLRVALKNSLYTQWTLMAFMLESLRPEIMKAEDAAKSEKIRRAREALEKIEMKLKTVQPTPKSANVGAVQKKIDTTYTKDGKIVQQPEKGTVIKKLQGSPAECLRDLWDSRDLLKDSYIRFVKRKAVIVGNEEVEWRKLNITRGAPDGKTFSHETLRHELRALHDLGLIRIEKVGQQNHFYISQKLLNAPEEAINEIGAIEKLHQKAQIFTNPRRHIPTFNAIKKQIHTILEVQKPTVYPQRFINLKDSNNNWPQVHAKLQEESHTNSKISSVVQIISNDEYRMMTSGVMQRGKALVRLLQDIYSGEWKIVNHGIIPQAVIEKALATQGYQELVGAVQPESIAITYGPDLCYHNGYVLEDNIGDVGGREGIFSLQQALRVVFPNMKLKDHHELRKKYFDDLRRILPIKRGTIAYWQDPIFDLFHAFQVQENELAHFAIPVVNDEKETQFIVEPKKGLFTKTTDGLLTPVRYLMYHEYDFSLDPDWKPFQERMQEFGYEKISSGIPGIVDLVREGNVLLSHQVGSSLADSKLIYPFVEKCIEYYLNEEPILHNTTVRALVPQYDLPIVTRTEIIAAQKEYVLKPIRGESGVGVIIGRNVSPAVWVKAIDNALENAEDYLLFGYVDSLVVDDRITVHRVLTEVMPDLQTALYPGVFAREKEQGNDGVIGMQSKGMRYMMTLVEGVTIEGTVDENKMLVTETVPVIKTEEDLKLFLENVSLKIKKYSTEYVADENSICPIATGLIVVYLKEALKNVRFSLISLVEAYKDEEFLTAIMSNTQNKRLDFDAIARVSDIGTINRHIVTVIEWNNKRYVIDISRGMRIFELPDAAEDQMALPKLNAFKPT